MVDQANSMPKLTRVNMSIYVGGYMNRGMPCVIYVHRSICIIVEMENHESGRIM